MVNIAERISPGGALCELQLQDRLAFCSRTTEVLGYTERSKRKDRHVCSFTLSDTVALSIVLS